MPQVLIYLIPAAVLVFLAAAELLSLRVDPNQIRVRCETDMRLTEPDEAAVLRFQVQNSSRLPLLFVSFSLRFSDSVELREDEGWRKAHQVGGALAPSYLWRISLPPRRGFRGRLRFSLKERGLHELGKVYLETVDFFGFRSRVRSFDMGVRLVCTARSLGEAPGLLPLGGFLGDLSVRRFILEDPSLILGYRDYSGAEAMKHISWLQTARRGRLTVKNHDFTVDADVRVLLNMERCAEETAERCLSLLRTVCDALEARHIPYSVGSNGDLFETARGIGRKHSFEVQRRIGLSRFVRYRDFGELLAAWARPGFSRLGCIVVTPRTSPALSGALARLEAASGVRVCLLAGEEAREDA